MFASFFSVGVFEENKCKRKQCKQNKKSGNNQHFNKIDILNNNSENVNNVIT